MKFQALLIAAALLAGCAAPGQSDRSGGPLNTFNSSKPDVAVAECIQVSWQDAKLFGDTADVFKDRLDKGGFTVFTTQGRYFADVQPHDGATQVQFFAPGKGEQTALRAASIATCL